MSTGGKAQSGRRWPLENLSLVDVNYLALALAWSRKPQSGLNYLALALALALALYCGQINLNTDRSVNEKKDALTLHTRLTEDTKYARPLLKTLGNVLNYGWRVTTKLSTFIFPDVFITPFLGVKSFEHWLPDTLVQ